MWEDNVGRDLNEVKWQDVAWINVPHVWDKWWVFVHTAMNLRVP
jgi:hypothetical protein